VRRKVLAARGTNNRKSKIKNPMPLFGWTWLDVAFVVIMPLLLLVGLFARRRRRMTT